MFELPVNPPENTENSEKAERRVLRVTWFGLFTFLLLLIIWGFITIVLGSILDVDTNCLDLSGRRSGLIEMPLCLLKAGPSGWFYLAWWTAPFWALRSYLKRKLGDGTKAAEANDR
jgi:hypothetical protein